MYGSISPGSGIANSHASPDPLCRTPPSVLLFSLRPPCCRRTTTPSERVPGRLTGVRALSFAQRNGKERYRQLNARYGPRPLSVRSCGGPGPKRGEGKAIRAFSRGGRGRSRDLEKNDECSFCRRVSGGRERRESPCSFLPLVPPGKLASGESRPGERIELERYAPLAD